MAKTKRSFDAALAAFIKGQNNLANLARECANLALTHFDEHGDVSYLQRFHDAFRQNFMRKKALVAWACEHMPLTYEGNKFSKNKADDAVKPNLTAAVAVDFWDFKPEGAIEFYVGSDVLKALNKILDNFDAGKKKKPANDKAHDVVIAARRVLSNLSVN